MTPGYLNLTKGTTMNANENKKEKKKYWECLKILANPKTKKNISEGNAGLKKKKDLGIFWEAEADIIRTDLLDGRRK